MITCGGYMLEFSVTKDMENNNNGKRRIPTYLLNIFSNIDYQIIEN